MWMLIDTLIILAGR